MKNSSTFIAFITALSLHLIIGAVILLGLDFNFLKDKPKPEAVVINASMVNQKLFDDLAAKREQQKADLVAAEKRKLEQEKQKLEQQKKEQARVKREKELAEQKLKQAQQQRIQQEQAEAKRIEKEEERRLFEEIVAAKEKRAKEEAKKAKEIADAKKKKEEQARIQKEKEELKRLEAEKIKAEKALQEKLAKEAKIKAEKEKQEKLKAEKAEKERQAKLKAEQEAKARKEAAEKAERLRQAELDKQMQAAFEDSFSSARSSKQLSEISRYQALIRDKISRNWQIDPSMKGKSCTLAIRLAPDGLVLSVNQSKGDNKLCDSAKRATFKAKILPIPKDPEISTQFRDFDITLEPEL